MGALRALNKRVMFVHLQRVTLMCAAIYLVLIIILTVTCCLAWCSPAAY